MNSRYLSCLALVLTITAVQAQEKLTLAECYRLARENYPVIKKMDLISQTSQFTLENANKRYLPQISFSGQASYQSQTIAFPSALAGALPQISKDQYKIQGEVDQQLYDGGAVHQQNEVTKANTDLQRQNLEVSLYTLNDRVNNIFFSILLVDAQLKQNELQKGNLQTQAQKTQASFNNGVAFQSNVNELQAEVMSTDMATTEYTANRTAYLRMLSLLIGKEVTSSAQLQTPGAISHTGDINRPELKAYDLQKSVYDAQEKQLRSDYLPKFSAFFQGAYGRPTLNIVENQFGAWYITGIRLNWSLGSLYTLGNSKKILNLNRQSADADKATFLLNTKMDLAQQDEQVKKYNDLIQQDEKTIALRESVTKSATAQLENGVITTHEYVQQVNAENLARQNLILHRIQLVQAQYNFNYKSGN
ncbi:TolC family protein [Mucilaginibacter sp. cycad4]|uniref:TolC family protein n=1 Tax=Mucilaginibacter sp. cycad4 TaxID=3342096 RepID=UPI002AAB7A3F|nr:TolC family protein [Mucilaginibacter gossypii]WPV01566.1 TolC family protein [Mucilaginibacter gossypii]